MAASKTILLVEDEALIAMNEAAQLRREGYYVRFAYSGEEALAEVKAASHAIDLILMDINLGAGIDGTQAAQAILALADIPIIFLSSHTEPEIVAKTEKITSYGYVVKNSGSTVLSASIKMAFKLHSAHQALQRTNEKLSLAQEASHAGAWDWDISNNLFDWTPQLRATLSISPHEPAGLETWSRVIHPDDREMAARALWNAIENKIDLLNDYRIVCPDGSVRWIRTTGKTYYAGGFPVRMSGMCMDITESKQVEKALAHSHALMQYVIEHSRSAIAVHDCDLKYIYVSQRYLDEYRVKERDIIGRHHYEVFPDLPQKWRDVHHRALAGEVLQGEDDPYIREDGSVDWTRWECRPWHEADGSIGGIIVYTEVITGRKQAELNLKRNEVCLEAIFNNSRDAIAVAKNGLHALANPAYAVMFGYSSLHELIGRPILGLIAPECRADIRQKMQRREIGAAAPALYETVGLRKDGTIFAMEVSASRYKVDAEVYTLVILRDISDRKCMEESLKARTSALKERIKEINCLYNISRLVDTHGDRLDRILTGLPHLLPPAWQHPAATYARLTIDGRVYETDNATDSPWQQTCDIFVFGKQIGTITVGYLDPPLVEDQEPFTAAEDNLLAAIADRLGHIIERMQAQEALRRMLEEKEVLMHELQHRVKNSLAVAASLIGIEMGNLPDAYSRSIFSHTQERILSMASVYEQLYHAEEVDSIDLRQYIQNLVLSLSQSYFPETGKLTIEENLVELQLKIKPAISVGIILNELVTNAYKYAFPPQKSQQTPNCIRIQLAREAGQARLCVSDNGAGVRPDFLKKDGSGLALVEMLTRQLGGRLLVNSSAGFSVCIIFPLD